MKKDSQETIMENLIFHLREAHQHEIEKNHYGDRECSCCQAMRAGCEYLEIELPEADWVNLEAPDHIFMP